MPRQLNIRSDEAYHLARTLAARENVAMQEIVLRALRDYARRRAPDGPLTAEQDADLARLRAAAREARAGWLGGEDWRDDLYDEAGLPR